MKITDDWYRIFHPSKMLFPVLIEHISILERTRLATHILGWTDVFIFGIRVARIGRTKPWE